MKTIDELEGHDETESKNKAGGDPEIEPAEKIEHEVSIEGLVKARIIAVSDEACLIAIKCNASR
ncbi:hypothetical protein ACUHMQ_19095 [Chitinimonas sp. PSY-7]|uniref:hypothetical protein n=1 Tax=Chitinimonas sp. PSY-7 TaxID=3459088 RepID=UPI0040401ECB